MVTTFKCEFVAQTTLLSSPELLVGAASAAGGSAAADEEAATGQARQVPADIIINLFVLDQVCLTNTIQFKRARRVQAGRPGAGRNKAVAHRMYSDVCTSMCPLIHDQKSAVKVYTSVYSVYTSIYFI